MTFKSNSNNLSKELDAPSAQIICLELLEDQAYELGTFLSFGCLGLVPIEINTFIFSVFLNNKQANMQKI